MQQLHNMPIKQTIPKTKTNCQKKDFKGQSQDFIVKV